MSAQLKAFIAPYESQINSQDAYQTLLTLGSAAWNLALEPVEKRQALIEPLLVSLGGKDSADGQMLLRIVSDLIQRKETDPGFAQDRRAIVSFALKEEATGGRLEVVSAVPTE